MNALPVVGQGLDDPALGDLTVLAGDHVLQLIPQGSEAGDLVLDRGKVDPGDVVHLTAGTVGCPREVQELPDGLDLEPELPRVAYEVEPADVLGTVSPLLALGPDRLCQQ